MALPVSHFLNTYVTEGKKKTHTQREGLSLRVQNINDVACV